MGERRIEALKLRLKGYSYNEIRTLLGVPKATQSGWFKHVVLSDAARARLQSRVREGAVQGFVRRNKLQTMLAQKRAKAAQDAAYAEIDRLDARDLRIVGAALYWAEGHKRLKVRDGKERAGHAISFVNSDSEMVRIFIRFLKETLSIPSDRIRVFMRLYAHIGEKEAREHWMRATGLPAESFGKTSYLVTGASKGVRPYNRLPFGTVQIQVSDTPKFHHILGLIEGVKKGL